MRKVSLVFGTLSLFMVYLFACGGLNTLSGNQELSSFLLLPFQEFNLLEGSVLVMALIFMAVAVMIIPDSRRDRSAAPPRLSWQAALNLAFFVNSLVVAGIGVLLVWGPIPERDPVAVGILYAAGIYEAVLGAILVTVLLFCRRPRMVFLPALGLFLAGLLTLGALAWLGSGTSL